MNIENQHFEICCLILSIYKRSISKATKDRIEKAPIYAIEKAPIYAIICFSHIKLACLPSSQLVPRVLRNFEAKFFSPIKRLRIKTLRWEK